MKTDKITGMNHSVVVAVGEQGAGALDAGRAITPGLWKQYKFDSSAEVAAFKLGLEEEAGDCWHHLVVINPRDYHLLRGFYPPEEQTEKQTPPLNLSS